MLSLTTGLTPFGKVSLIMRFPLYDFPRSIKALSFMVLPINCEHDHIVVYAASCSCSLVHWSRRCLAVVPSSFQVVPIVRSRARAIQRLAWSMSTLHVESRTSMSWAGRRAVVMRLPESVSVTRIERSLR